jgi:1-acyl-sn-glycerol-3-phosphate acyltransferase
MSYISTRALVRFGLRLIAQVKIDGLERVPVTGPLLVASNHLGRLDAALVYLFSDRQDIAIMIAEKYEKSAVWRWLARELNGFFVDRYNADLRAIRQGLERLKQGNMLVIAPEGTRSPTAALIEARPGSIYLAAKARVPILPVAISGSEDRAVVASLRRLRRPQILVRVGHAFTLPELTGANREAILQEHTTDVMCHIAALLPPAYRGFYAEHPRLKALLGEEPR